MKNLMNKEWWNAALTRALKTIAQTAVALIGTGVTGIIEVDWLNLLSVAGLAGLVSILTSIAGIPEVKYKEQLTEIEFDVAEEGGDEDGTADEI